MKQRTALLFTWAWWLLIGILMVSKGIRLSPPEELKQGVIFGFLLGFFIHFLILRKSNRKLIAHVRGLQTPIKFRSLYPKSVFINLFALYLLGTLANFFPLSIRDLAVIDFAIGISVLNGAADFVTDALFAKKKVFKP